MTFFRATGSERASRRTTTRPIIPPTALVVLGVLSVQLGSAAAKGLFTHLGPGGAAFLRVAFAALALLAIWRPRVDRHTQPQLVTASIFGLVVAGMNLSFYSALNRIPLGIAVTLEFLGPLGVAVLGSRRTSDLLWAGLAACGIALLAPWGGLSLDPVGIMFALLAGALWAAYIVLSARVGRDFAGGGGLAIAMGVGGTALLPIGVVSAGTNLLRPDLLLGGVALAVLSSVIPYSLELEALRHMPTRVFGVLMSLEPAVAALVGFAILGQVLGIRVIVALAFVSVASLGASRSARTPAID